MSAQFIQRIVNYVANVRIFIVLYVAHRTILLQSTSCAVFWDRFVWCTLVLTHSHVWLVSISSLFMPSSGLRIISVGCTHGPAAHCRRVYTYVYQQEVLIKGLANSKTFQRFALRTDHHVQQYKKKGQEHVNEALDDLHKTATETMYKAQGEARASGYAAGGSAGGAGPGSRAAGPPTPPLRGFGGFISAVGKEIRKDLGLGR
jgi:hypothetical protein